MNDQTIANEAAFVQTLGIDPNSVQQGSVRIEFIEGRPVVRYAAAIVVPPHLVGLAFMAAAGHEIVHETPDGTPVEPETIPEGPEDPDTAEERTDGD